MQWENRFSEKAPETNVLMLRGNDSEFKYFMEDWWKRFFLGNISGKSACYICRENQSILS